MQNQSSEQRLNEQLLQQQQQLEDEYTAVEQRLMQLQNKETVKPQEKDDSDEEQEQQLKDQLERIKKQIKEKKKLRKKNSRVLVGTGFGLDITEFFKFKKRKELISVGEKKSIFEEIAGSHLAWIILFYSVINAAIIPSWIMNIKATKLLRISWRFILQALMMIPFVLYEKRMTDDQIQKKYKLSYIFQIQHLKKAYLSSFSTSLYFTILLTCFEWTYISHAIVLSGLANFFLSIGRTTNKNGHDLEPGGQVLIIIGIFLILVDSYTFRTEQYSPQETSQYINIFFIHRNQIQRILADLVALGLAFVLSKFSILTADLKNHYPPFLSMFIVNFFIAINMTISAYYFNGATFDFESNYGIFSLLSQKHFAGFLYMSIILCMGLIISSVMISKLFPDPIVPSLAMCLQPSISTFFLQITGVQMMPGAFTFIGYAFIIPGNFLILIGHWIFQRSHKKEELQEKKRLTQLLQLKNEKQKSLFSKKSFEMKQISFDNSQSDRIQLKRKDTYDEKFKKKSYSILRPQTLHHIPSELNDKQQQGSPQCDMTKKDKSFKMLETTSFEAKNEKT